MREHDTLHVLGAHAVDIRTPVNHGVARADKRVHKLLPVLPPHNAQSQELLAVALLAQRVLQKETGSGLKGGSVLERMPTLCFHELNVLNPKASVKSSRN